MSGTILLEKLLLPTFVATATLGSYPNYQNNYDLSLRNQVTPIFHSNKTKKLPHELQPSYDTYEPLKILSDIDKVKIVSEFANNLLLNSVDLEIEISKMIDEDFWDLI